MAQIDRVTGLKADVSLKVPCLVATTANITLSGTQTIDGVAVAAGDRVLVRAQSTTSENGIYIVAAGAWSRSPDFEKDDDLVQGGMVLVRQGSIYALRIFTLTTASPAIGSALAFSALADASLAGLSSEITALGALATEIEALGALTTEIAALYALETELTALGALTTEIGALGALTSEITALGALTSEITALGAITANITTVAGISANVTTVAGISSNVTTVAGISANVTTVAGIDTEVAALAALSSEITALGSITAAISAVAAIDTEVGTVAGISANVTTVAGIAANVTSVAAVDTEITALAALTTEITALGAITADITAVAAVAGDLPAIAALAAGAVAEADYNANTILAANADDTPLALTVDEDRIVGRISGGNIAALTANQLLAMLVGGTTYGMFGLVSDDGTKTTGTYTPTPASGGPFKTATNNGAHILAPFSPSNDLASVIDVFYTNGASAGAITTTGFTKVTGDSFDTTNGNKFWCRISVIDDGGAESSHLHVVAMQ